MALPENAPSAFDARVTRAHEACGKLRSAIGEVIVGQDEVVAEVLWGLLAGGHVLLEGNPGLGKTLLVRTLASCLDLGFSRIQFTPDLMPSDVTGTNVLSLASDGGGSGRFELHRGPIFGQIVLADEINRATPKTQSALLEAMQEHAVTIAGTRHVLEEPFFVLATQNPIEMEGTYPLPEAQLDRFLMKIVVPYPSREDLARVVDLTCGGAGWPVVRSRIRVRSSSPGAGTSTLSRKRSSWASGSGYVPSISIGFSVASTKYVSSSAWRVPRMVTACSCMASSSALCVFGVARLISSASTTCPKIGPRWSSKRPVTVPPPPSASMFVPVTSLGIRSGVN
jgi:hypothetical protein